MFPLYHAMAGGLGHLISLGLSDKVSIHQGFTDTIASSFTPTVRTTIRKLCRSEGGLGAMEFRNDPRTYFFIGETSTIDFYVTTFTSTTPRGVTVIDGNLHITQIRQITGEPRRIRKFVGLSGTLDSNLNTTYNIEDIASDNNDDILTYQTTNRIRRHDGFTNTILNDFTITSGGGSSGITFNKKDLFVASTIDGKIYHFDGVSNTLLFTLTSPTNGGYGLAASKEPI